MPEDVRKEFGKRLRDLRTTRGLSQEELAYRCGLSQVYISQTENGHRNISLMNIARLAAALDVSLQDIMPPDYLPRFWS